MEIFLHEYLLGLYGVILWQVEQAFAKKGFTFIHAIRNVGRSMIWVGAIVVFDDELLSRYNAFANLDYVTPTWWMYVASGFSIDLIRSYFTKDKKDELIIERERRPVI